VILWWVICVPAV